MKRLLFLLLLLAVPAWAGDYDLTLSGDSTAACTISFSTEAESSDGTHPLENGDITAFACTITEADPDLVLGLSDLQYPAGLDYRVSGGKVTAFDLQTTTGNMLQIGNASPTTIDNTWQVFGTGTPLASASNRVAIADAAGGPQDTTPPTTPGNFAAVTASSTQIDLSWDASTDDTGVTDYLVESCEGAACADFLQIGTSNGALVYYSAGLTPNTLYRYRVRAVDAADNRSAYSSIEEDTTNASGVLSFAAQTGTMAVGEWKPLDTENDLWDPGVMVTRTESDAICAAATPECDLNEAVPPKYINGFRNLVVDNGEYGSSQMFTAWNSAAYNRPENEMYFFGGGHYNYGGTEVIKFDLDTLTWTRVGPHLPLNEFHTSPDRWHPTDADSDGYPDAPPMPHTYDGWTWFQAAAGGAGRALITDMVAIYPSSGNYSGHLANYMFDPDTGTWTHHPTAGYFYSSCVEIVENNELLCFNDQSSGQQLPAYKIAADGTETYCGLNLPGVVPNFSAVMSFRNPTSGKYYVSHYLGIQELTIDTNDTCDSSLGPINYIPIELYNKHSEGGIGGSCPAAGIGSDWIYYWNGARWMLGFNTATETWEMIWNDAGKGANAPGIVKSTYGYDRIYEKCACLPSDGACVFISNAPSQGDYDVPATGLYVWKAAPNPANVDQVDIGTLTLDGRTQTMLTLFLPVDGDKNFDAVASTRYRVVGAGSWTTGINLERIHPEYTQISRRESENRELPVEGFAGVIWNLTPGTDYEVEVTVSDPDGTIGTTPQTLASVSTLALPISDYSALGETIVTTVGQINSGAVTQCDGTGTGHVFTVAAGTTIDATTTPIAFGPPGAGDCGSDLANPIVLRGEDQATSIIDCRGVLNYCIRVFGGHAIVENLTILADNRVTAGVEVGGRTGSCEIGNVTVRNMVIGSQTGPVNTYGVNAGPCALHDVYIADNVAYGRFSAGGPEEGGPDEWGGGSGGGGDRGFTVTGRDIEVVHNLAHGFIDGFITSGAPATDPPTNSNVPHTQSIIFQYNIADHGVDDGLELDYTYRNTIAVDNLFTNNPSGVSFQPIWGGPAFAIHNIIYNHSSGWMKIKPELDNPAGIFVYNNTAIKNGTCLHNDSGNVGRGANMRIMNNLFVCQGTQYQGLWLMLFKIWMTHGSSTVDYNVWAGPDNQFQMGEGSVTQNHIQSAANFAAWVAAGIADGGWGIHDTHADPLTIFDTLVLDFDDTAGGDLYGAYARTYLGKSFLLDDSSPAKDVGTPLPGITPDGDANPDVGACQFSGQCEVINNFYGVRP